MLQSPSELSAPPTPTPAAGKSGETWGKAPTPPPLPAIPQQTQAGGAGAPWPSTVPPQPCLQDPSPGRPSSSVPSPPQGGPSLSLSFSISELVHHLPRSRPCVLLLIAALVSERWCAYGGEKTPGESAVGRPASQLQGGHPGHRLACVICRNLGWCQESGSVRGWV